MINALRKNIQKTWLKYMPPPCKLCGAKTTSCTGYGRVFAKCLNCGFIFTNDYDPQILNRGMGMEGSWTGPGGGGYREYFLVKKLIEDLQKQSFLLFGTGNTPTFAKLREEGVDVTGCDISRDVVEFKVRTHGEESFFTPENLPTTKKYDGIVAVEVFEHFTEPRVYFNLLVSRLAKGGVICGTTNFYPGGPIEDGNNPGYMSHQGHVAYWSYDSMSYIARTYGYAVAAFEMICPGSVLPDEKFGQLWPNKRVFFIYNQRIYTEYFQRLRESTPILPIDKP